MERQYVTSSMITSIGYDYDNAVLEIEFKSNHQVWNYYDVPSYVYEQMMAVDSHGKYFHSNILKQYREGRAA